MTSVWRRRELDAPHIALVYALMSPYETTCVTAPRLLLMALGCAGSLDAMPSTQISDDLSNSPSLTVLGHPHLQAPH